MAVENMACPPDEPVETCSRSTNEQDLLLTCLDASTILRGDLLWLSLAVFLANLETTPGTAAVTVSLMIHQNRGFDAQIFNF